MLDQRISRRHNPIVIEAYRPDIGGREGGDAIEECMLESTRIGCGYLAPLRTIPMFDQGSIGHLISLIVVAHGPGIIGRKCCHSVEHVHAGRSVGAGNDLPRLALAGSGECLYSSGAGKDQQDNTREQRHYKSAYSASGFYHILLLMFYMQVTVPSLSCRRHKSSRLRRE